MALLGAGQSRRDLAELDRAGVRGARLHFLAHLGGELGHREQRDALRAIADLGWHTEIHVQGSGVVEREAMIAAVPGPVVIDHMARVDLREGLDGPSVHSLLRLLDRGNVWVKVSGADRVSREGPPYTDAAELGALLVRHNPERVLWGTDYPHPNIVGPAPDDGVLVDLIATMAPTEKLRGGAAGDEPGSAVRVLSSPVGHDDAHGSAVQPRHDVRDGVGVEDGEGLLRDVAEMWREDGSRLGPQRVVGRQGLHVEGVDSRSGDDPSRRAAEQVGLVDDRTA